MIRSREKEELSPKLLERFSNERLIIEECRKSRLTRKDKSEIEDTAFSGTSHRYYSTEDLATLLRKAVYQINFDQHLKHELFCAINSVLVELVCTKNKSERLIESEKHLGDIFELMVYLGQTDSDGFLHDEAKGGWHHPEYRP